MSQCCIYSLRPQIEPEGLHNGSMKCHKKLGETRSSDRVRRIKVLRFVFQKLHPLISRVGSVIKYTNTEKVKSLRKERSGNSEELDHSQKSTMECRLSDLIPCRNIDNRNLPGLM